MSPGSFAVALLLLATSTLARIDLVQPAGSRYGYGVSQPAKWTKALSARPLTLFLHGSSQRTQLATDASGNGSCGSFDQASSNLRFNGLGNLIQLYEQGSRAAAPVLAAEQFLVVLPLAPLTTPLDSGFQRYCVWPVDRPR